MMKQRDIFTKVGNILAELNEQYEFLAQNPAQLNDLELELFLANADFLADHVRIVQKLNAAVEKQSPPVQQPVLEDKGATAVSEVSPVKEEADEDFASAELQEVAAAEEQEERVDVKQAQEVLDDEKIHEETTAKVLQNDFFKPDHEDHTFEFVLGNHSEDDQFDYEAKSVEEIFDRPLSKAEEEVLAQKKKMHEEAPLNAQTEPALSEEDEIGPEPFLISHEEEEQAKSVELNEEIEVPAPAVEVKSEPIAALKDVEMDEPVISPPVAEKPVFTPEAVPVKPVSQPPVSHPAPSLNDLLAKTQSKNDEPVKAPISDLKQAISLNQKLLFIKDLFKGYNLAYSEAIDIVNKMSSFEIADSFLQSNYAIKNDWANKQATVDQFYELLNRRFSK